MTSACPACGGGDLRVFHEQSRVPVHSCRLVATRAEAEAFPTGELRVAVCADCGLATNVAWEPGLQDYFVAYEETQAFSPRFREFMRELARRWVERYDLRGKTVVEIGSGKGEFLLELAECGIGRGIGIDPGFVPERVSGAAAERVEWIKDYYSERFAHLRGDAIVCRHTLEHIHDVGDFMRLIRASIGDRRDVAVLFELPDLGRVLREAAFWDVYYEHTSYFTPGSLARLFRRTGFEVVGLALDYDDQYVLIEARPGDVAAHGAAWPLEEDPSEVVAAADRFRRRVAGVVEHWRRVLADARAAGRRVVLWGSGSKGVAFLTTLGVPEEIEYVVDINPHKHGMFMAGSGREIVPPAFLREYRPNLVIAMNPVYLREIGAELAALGVEAELTAVG